MKNKNYSFRYYLFKTLDITLSILPLLVYGIINFDKYFGMKTTTFSNIIGFGTLIAIMVLILSKKTKMLQGMFGLVLIEIILIFLDVYVKDLKFILGMGIIGLGFSKVFIHPFVEKYQRLKDKQETAEENANALNKGLDKIINAVKGEGRA